MVTLGDIVGNLGKLLVVQGLGDIDEQRGMMPVFDHTVQETHIIDTDDVVELDIFGERLEHLGLRGGLCRLLGVIPVGAEQEHSFLIELQVESLEVTGRGHQRAIKTVDDVAQLVVLGVELVHVAQQAYLVVEPLLAEHLDHVLGKPLIAHKGDIVLDNLLHLRLDAVEHLLGDGCLLMLEHAVVAVAHTVHEAQALAGVAVVHRLVHDHAQRTDVGALHRRVLRADKLNLLWAIDAEAHVLALVVDECQHRALVWLGVHAAVDVKQRLTTRDGNILVDVLAVDVQFVHFYLG